MGIISHINCIINNIRLNERDGSCLDLTRNRARYVAHSPLTVHFSISTNISDLVFNGNNPPNLKTKSLLYSDVLCSHSLRILRKIIDNCDYLDFRL